MTEAFASDGPTSSKPRPAAGGNSLPDGRTARSGKTTKTSMTSATYEPVAFADLPNWAADDHLAAFKAFLVSCPKVKQRVARNGRDAALGQACDAASAMPAKVTRVMAKGFFEQHFQPHRVVHAAREGLLTGYYEPLIEGSRTRDARFQTALFKRPPDLVTVVPETRGAVAGTLTHARRTSAGLVPHLSRAEIDRGALAGQGLELLYLADPVDKFFLQIQGSGRIKLRDGTTVRVQYDGKNGHPYSSIGRYLIDKGLLAADRMSMGALSRWLKADLARGREVMNQNASYVFFKELPAAAEGPLGALEVALKAGRSLAIDPGLHRLGSPIYVSAPTLRAGGTAQSFHRLMIAQDVGSAIKGPERGDIYFGSGETAAAVAGKVRHPGNLFVFVARGTAAAGTPGGKAVSTARP